jgi:hypothetical protein
VLRARIEKVNVVASSKKTSPSKNKSSKSKAAESIVEDATIVEDETSSDAAEEDVVEAVEASAADVSLDIDQTVEDTLAEQADEISDDQQDAVKDEVNVAPERVEPAPVAPAQEQGSRFFPLVLGGIIAGGLGFLAGEMDFFGNSDAEITNRLRSDLNTQQERLAKLETTKAPVIDLSPLEAQLVDIKNRITVLEERPVGVGSGGDDASAAELEALRSSVEALLSNAKTVEQATAEAAKAAAAQAAITTIVSAMNAGQPFPDAVATLEGLDLGEIDPALLDAAADGVAALNTLQSEYPDQARAALAAARASGVDDGQQGLGGFLKRSLGARSVAPREGDDPDAVLSRAEAALKSGDLTTALTELDTLPEEAQAAIADWRVAAEARVAAGAATDALAKRLTAD